jgi:putative RNA 2'-phosphotransferase
MSDTVVKTSKFLSFVLRHGPQSIGLELDNAGWADVDELMRRASSAGRPLTRDLLREVVETNDKQRFSFSDDGQRIRANHGHSIDVDLGLESVAPPDLLLHGTARTSLSSVLEKGLLKRQRQHVHLSLDVETAIKVGRRHGSPVVLRVDSGGMHSEGSSFYLSENGVWLTENVPPGYLSVIE